MYISAYASIHMYKYLYIHLITLQRLVLGNPNGLQFRICFAPPWGSRYIILLKLLHTRAETKVHHICKKEPLQHTIHTAHGRNPANQLRLVVSWWCRISSINSLNSYLKLFGKRWGATRVYASFRKQGDVVRRFSPQSASTACQDEQWWTCILQHQHLNIKKDTTITIFGDLPGFSKHM